MPREYTIHREVLPTVPLLYRGDTIHVDPDTVDGWLARGAERPGAAKKPPKAAGAGQGSGEGAGGPPAPPAP